MSDDKPLSIDDTDAGFAAYMLVENLISGLRLNTLISPVLSDAIAKLSLEACSGQGMSKSAALIEQRFPKAKNMSIAEAALAIGFDVERKHD